MFFASNDKLFSRELKILGYDEIWSFDWIKLIHSYRLVNIDWLPDSNWLDGLTYWTNSVRRKTPCEDLVNKGSNFADIVRFPPYTYTHTLNNLCRPLREAIIVSSICLKNLITSLISTINAILSSFSCLAVFLSEFLCWRCLHNTYWCATFIHIHANLTRIAPNT